jgi:Fe2+ or Zn2+ uptake regulation protein
LVSKHQFGRNIAQYEKSYGRRQHDHLICTDCHHVTEFCDPRVQTIQSMVGEMLQFNVMHHSLIFMVHVPKRIVNIKKLFNNSFLLMANPTIRKEFSEVS